MMLSTIDRWDEPTAPVPRVPTAPTKVAMPPAAAMLAAPGLLFTRVNTFEFDVAADTVKAPLSAATPVLEISTDVLMGRLTTPPSVTVMTLPLKLMLMIGAEPASTATLLIEIGLYTVGETVPWLPVK